MVRVESIDDCAYRVLGGIVGKAVVAFFDCDIGIGVVSTVETSVFEDAVELSVCGCDYGCDDDGGGE